MRGLEKRLAIKSNQALVFTTRLLGLWLPRVHLRCCRMASWQRFCGSAQRFCGLRCVRSQAQAQECFQNSQNLQLHSQ